MALRRAICDLYNLRLISPMWQRHNEMEQEMRCFPALLRSELFYYQLLRPGPRDSYSRRNQPREQHPESLDQKNLLTEAPRYPRKQSEWHRAPLSQRTIEDASSLLRSGQYGSRPLAHRPVPRRSTPDGETLRWIRFNKNSYSLWTRRWPPSFAVLGLMVKVPP